MIDMIYIAQVQEPKELQQSGMIHSKVARRFEIVKELPKVANSFDEMFDYADAYGDIKLVYIDSAHRISSTRENDEKKATAVGGQIGIKTAEYNGVRLHLSAYISQGLNFLNSNDSKLNEDLFSVNTKSFIYGGIANIEYNTDVVQVKLGRLRVETPYANSDDIRLASNTFEGAWANIDYTSNLTTQLIYLKKWAGYDSQDEESGVFQDQFKDLVNEDSFGMIGASLTYQFAKNSEVSFWYNYIDEMASIAYAEVIGIYFVDGENFHFDYGLQASYIEELSDSKVDGEVLGAMAIFHYHGLFLGGAYNIAYSDTSKYVTNGFGGGPYYTSLDEATISAISEGLSSYQDTNSDKTYSNNNNESFRIGVGYEFENISVDGLVMEFVYGELYNDNGKIKENDLILSYEVNDRIGFEATYTNYESSCDNNTFDRTMLKLDYSF